MSKIATLNYMHICDHAMVDQGGKVGVIGIFQKIVVQGLPAVHQKITVVVSVNFPKIDNRDHDLKIRIVGPGGNELSNTPFNIGLDKVGDAVFIGNHYQVGFTTAGQHYAELLIDEEVIGKSAFNVTLLEDGNG